jgi:hypothetical protein
LPARFAFSAVPTSSNLSPGPLTRQSTSGFSFCLGDDWDSQPETKSRHGRERDSPELNGPPHKTQDTEQTISRSWLINTCFIALEKRRSLNVRTRFLYNRMFLFASLHKVCRALKTAAQPLSSNGSGPFFKGFIGGREGDHWPPCSADVKTGGVGSPAIMSAWKSA